MTTKARKIINQIEKETVDYMLDRENLADEQGETITKENALEILNNIDPLDERENAIYDQGFLQGMEYLAKMLDK